MPTIDEIKEQLKSVDGATKLFGFKEIGALPDILWEDERIEKLIQGSYGANVGVLVATNKRIIFVDKGLIYGIRVEDFAYNQISSLQYQTGLIYGKITIFCSGNKADMDYLLKDEARDFAEFVRARITGPAPHASVPQPSTPPVSNDVVGQLERLAKLKEQGFLTDNEFEEQKRKILGS